MYQKFILQQMVLMINGKGVVYIQQKAAVIILI